MRQLIALFALAILMSPAVAGPVGTPYRGPTELLTASSSGQDQGDDAPVVEDTSDDTSNDNTDPNTQVTPEVNTTDRGTTAKLDGAILWSWYWEHNKDRWIARSTERSRVASGSAYYWFGSGAKFPPRAIVPVSARQRFEIWQALRTHLTPKKEKSQAVRAEACIAMGRLGQVPIGSKDKVEGKSNNWVVRDLTWVLSRESDTTIRRAAILGLGISGDPDAGAFLMRVYSDLAVKQRPYALVALGLIRHLPAIPMLLDHLPPGSRSKATDEQLASIHAIGLYGLAAIEELNKDSRNGVGRIAQLVHLRGSQPTVMQAVATLGRLQQERKIVERAVRGSKSINIQWTSLLALSNFIANEKDAAAAAKLLQQNSTKGKGQSRNFAIFALGDLASRLDPNSKVRAGILAFLKAKALDTKNNYIRACGAVALGMAQDRTAIDAIAQLLDDSTVDDYVIGAACVALGLLGATDHADTLLKNVLSNKKWKADARGYALLGLALMGDTTRMSEIRRHSGLKGPTETSRQVPLAIGVLGDRNHVRQLMAYFAKSWKAQRLHTVSNAAFGMGWIKDQSAVGRLIRRLRIAQEESVRAMSAIALGYIGMPERVSALSRCYKNISYRNKFGGWKLLYEISRIL